MAPNNNQERLWGIAQCEVEVSSGACVGEYKSLWNGTLERNATARPEGPKMFLRGGWYYLVIAEGECFGFSGAGLRLFVCVRETGTDVKDT